MSDREPARYAGGMATSCGVCKRRIEPPEDIYFVSVTSSGRLGVCKQCADGLRGPSQSEIAWA